jgi:SAM-dependent methyltransferase
MCPGPAPEKRHPGGLGRLRVLRMTKKPEGSLVRSRAMAWVTRAVSLAAGGYLIVSLWLRRHPGAIPYGARLFLALPRRTLHWRQLLEVLAAGVGECVLEVGPGTGYYSLPVARSLGGGTLDVLDLRQEFLDHVVRRADAAGISNIRPRLGDGSALPYEDQTFESAFLITVLGEIPDQDAALRELRRVLRPGGRLIVGESIMGGDPHHVWFGELRSRVEAAGFGFEARTGGPLAYLASFRAPSA